MVKSTDSTQLFTMATMDSKQPSNLLAVAVNAKLNLRRPLPELFLVTKRGLTVNILATASTSTSEFLPTLIIIKIRPSQIMTSRLKFRSTQENCIEAAQLSSPRTSTWRQSSGLRSSGMLTDMALICFPKLPGPIRTTTKKRFKNMMRP